MRASRGISTRGKLVDEGREEASRCISKRGKVLDEEPSREEPSRGISMRGKVPVEEPGFAGEPPWNTAGMLPVVLLPFCSAMDSGVFAYGT
jgi:hypothetical protein